MWCMAGDFNSILNRDERRGSSSSLVSSDCVEFSQFVEDLELLDLPLVGSKFTWFVSNGSVMSRLDRFLINDSWSSTWGHLVQMSLKRTFSDHCPIVLKSDVNDWGPSPFRTNNCWFSNAEFGKFVEGTWNDLEVNGRGSFILKEKLKLLKISLKRWNKEHLCVLDRKINDQVNFINYVDGKGSIEALSVEDISARRSATAELWRLSNQKDNLLCQNSRRSWLKDGDSNSKFFHASINQRRRNNRIPGLFIEGEWIDDPPRAIPGGIDFVNISDEDNSFLTAEFEEVEIKEVVWSCQGDNSPGPDGFNFSFIKRVWDVVKDDIFAMVDDFYQNGNLVKGSNASFTVLVPKNECLQELGDFRPISLIGCL
ncbi:PREDICTED: uncharacterized protein LOC109340725 [Lupinus angustifolius]|uniref:uncharacterized protein LOC109340725 n=1 Tax=Lupinus angustifolius TaxID=3871 RepID=UPI00092F66C9|nr:PREDICTED: uncharacterized protein LOC109340725 [Lupinus angustifolius]